MHRGETEAELGRKRRQQELDNCRADMATLRSASVAARLACSRCAAVSTKALTRSFGWNAAESFQQHDVQEP